MGKHFVTGRIDSSFAARRRAKKERRLARAENDHTSELHDWEQIISPSQGAASGSPSPGSGLTTSQHSPGYLMTNEYSPIADARASPDVAEGYSQVTEEHLRQPTLSALTLPFAPLGSSQDFTDSRSRILPQGTLVQLTPRISNGISPRHSQVMLFGVAL